MKLFSIEAHNLLSIWSHNSSRCSWYWATVCV